MTLFTRIIDGEIPAEFIFQDERWVAFLDIFPTAPGHTLLVPRQPVAFLSELHGGTLAGMGHYIADLSKAVKRAAAAPACSVLIRDGAEAGQEIPHVHIHFIPRHEHAHAHHFSSGRYADDDDAVAEQLAYWGAAIRRHWSGV